MLAEQLGIEVHGILGQALSLFVIWAATYMHFWKVVVES